jgi:thioredoxin
MKNIIHLLPITAVIILVSCSGNSQQTQGVKYNLDAVAFAKKINELPGAPVLDVRTPEEFSNGHLQHALNVDWNGNNFENGIAGLEKSKPVFVYCLSGGRSHSAAEKMRAMGFTNVYELNGGIMKWRAANLPEENSNTAGMTITEFDQLITSDKKVLIDFYADWCGPCKKMAPYLEEMKTQMAGSVVIVRINADNNQTLAKTLHVDALPTLLLYKNKNIVWQHTGYIEQTELTKNITSR